MREKKDKQAKSSSKQKKPPVAPAPVASLRDPSLYINRELSLLAFQESG